jgi:photosystem II stability/assembly factor-like uncharacterized protein
MRRRTLILLIAVALGLSFALASAPPRAAALESTGDGGWVWQYGLGAGVTYDSVVFADANNGWAVGSGGRIMHTFDGGLTWYRQRSGTTSDLHQVQFVNDQDGWAIGFAPSQYTGPAPTDPVILRTTDGGDTWRQLSPMTSPWVPDSVVFTNPTDGWMDGSYLVQPPTTATDDLLHTTDGGTTWQSVTLATPDPTIGQIAFADPQDGWIADSSGVVWRTTDGGQTWASVGLPDSSGLATLACDGQTVLATSRFANGPGFCRSTDGGQTWSEVPSPVSGSLAAVAFASASDVWATAGAGELLHSSDAGATWSYLTTEPTYLSSIAFADDSHGWAVGVNGSMVSTQDGGASWTIDAAQAADPFWGISFPSANDGWAAATDGVVEHTTDAGATWSAPCAPRPSAFDAVDAVGARAWAVGTHGSIAATTDAGATWSAQAAPTWTDLNGVRFFDADNGWAVGDTGTILHTTNGGASWLACASGITDDLSAVDPVDAQHALVYGSHDLLATSDGGRTWQAMSVDGASFITLVDFIDPNDGWVTGGDMLYQTTDGGASWSDLSTIPVDWRPADFRTLHFSDLQNGWALDTSGKPETTTDGGLTWTVDPRATGWPDPDVGKPGLCVSGKAGWAVGGQGLVEDTTDGGLTWQHQTSGVSTDLSAVAAGNASDAVAVGAEGTLVSTTDGGATWTSAAYGVPQGLDSVSAVNARDAWAVSQAGIAHTTDSGITWSLRSPGFPAGHIDFVNALDGWVVGDDGSVARTTHGGLTWTPLDLDTGIEQMPDGVDFLTPELGWVASAAGPLCRTTDGGQTWTPQAGYDVQPQAIDFIDANDGWMVGATGMIDHSTNGGTSWTPQTSGTTKALQCVSFADALHGWTGGEDGTVLYTSDGGVTWVPEDSGTSQWIENVGCAGPSTAWIVGDDGGILATTDAGLSDPDDLAPVTTAHGVPAGWTNTADVALTLRATDPSSGAPAVSPHTTKSGVSGVRITGWALGRAGADPYGLDWHAGRSVSVTGQGIHLVYFRSVDDCGNAERVKTATVSIDTRPPTPLAPVSAKTVHGGVATLRFEVADPRPGSPTATVTIRVKDARGRVVKTILLRKQKVDTGLTCSFRCELAKGRYRFFVLATDAAGNRQRSVATNRLVVK